MRIPAGTQLVARQPLTLPSFVDIPEPEMPFPAASGTTLDPVPQTFPGSSLTYESFLYSQLQKSVQPGTANTFTATQTLSLPNDTNALVFNCSSAGPLNRKVKVTYADTWEVGTNLLNDGTDIDFYWLDKTIGLYRLRIDSDGQLSLPGWAATGGVSFNNAVNNTLNMAAKPLDGAPPVAGFGVGTLYRLPDGNGLVQTMGGLNCVLSDVTPGAYKSHLDLYAATAGAEVLAFTCGGAGGALIATDTAAAAITTVLTLQHLTGATSPGAGVQQVWQGKDSAAGDVILARTAALATTTTALAVDSAWVVVPKTGGTNVEVLRVRGGAGMAATADVTAVQGNVGGQVWVRGDLLVTGTGGSTVSLTDSGTNNEPALVSWQHRTTGAPLTGFGSQLKIQADNSANALTDQLVIATGWNSPTAGNETSLVEFFIRRAGADTEVMRLNANGNGTLQATADFKHAGAGLGFYGTTPIAKPTVAGSRGGNAALASLITQLAALGLLTDGSSA